jgi:hypothetical protein
MLMVFFNPKDFLIVDLLPQDTSVTAVYFVSNMILPLVNSVLNTPPRGYRPSQSAFGQFRMLDCWASPITNGQRSVPPCSTPAEFTRFGHLRLQPVWLVKAIAPRRTLDSEGKVLEPINEVLSELPKNKVKVRSCIGKKMPVGRRPQRRVLPESANAKLL